ncbi:MAG: hypothetical protein AB1831_03875 [Pseudomonadota bacterium]
MRLILAHKQKTSGRLRFLRLPHGTLLFQPLPRLSVLLDDAPPPRVAHHPAFFLKAAEDWLKLPAGSLEHEAEFQATVDTPEGPVAVYLVNINTIDPPFAEAQAVGGSFAAITELVGGMPAEMDLLRLAYTAVLG